MPITQADRHAAAELLVGEGFEGSIAPVATARLGHKIAALLAAQRDPLPPGGRDALIEAHPERAEELREHAYKGHPLSEVHYFLDKFNTLMQVLGNPQALGGEALTGLANVMGPANLEDLLRQHARAFEQVFGQKPDGWPYRWWLDLDPGPLFNEKGQYQTANWRAGHEKIEALVEIGVLGPDGCPESDGCGRSIWNWPVLKDAEVPGWLRKCIRTGHVYW